MSDKLFLTDSEIAKRVGLETEDFKVVAISLEREGFPAQDPLFKKRRYWPACKAFLDMRYGLGPRGMQAPPGLDGEERWD